MQRLIIKTCGELNVSADIIDLSRELAVALSDWKNGTWPAHIHPANDPRGVRFSPFGLDLETRLKEAGQAYRAIAEKIDPTAQKWWEMRDVDPSFPTRFMLVGERYS